MSGPREPTCEPTRAQAGAEKRLRETGIPITMPPHGLHPHVSPEPGCYTCGMLASIKRVNGGES